MTRRTVVVGSRGSGLALRQTQEVVAALRRLHPEVEFQVREVRTTGDAHPTAAIASLGLGAFTKAIEEALLRGEVDMAVHSLKDLPTRTTPGLAIAAVPPRADVRDALVDRWNVPLRELPPGARIGTGSPRRQAQLRAARPDVEVLPIRGNVDTRLRKASGQEYDGVVLAAAGLGRMGLSAQVAEYLDPTEFVPAPGQGALAVQVRADDYDTAALAAPLNHRDTRVAVTAERGLLERLGSGCHLAFGAYARVDGDLLVLTAVLCAPDGSRMVRAKRDGKASDPHGVALDMYERLLARGGRELLLQQQG